MPPQKDYSKQIEFAKLFLTRNDDAIRFSESKAELLFTFVGLLLKKS